MKYLFLVHIGPVQDFIASARRTCDLAFGSWFLSELSRAAAREITAQNGLDSLIFPAPATADMLQAKNKDFLVANKIIALVHQEPQTLGEQVRKAVQTQLRLIRDEAFNAVHYPGRTPPGAANTQVEDLLELFWTALPYSQGEYQQTRALLEALMAARKNTRDFAQVSWGSYVPKSSISGQLESVIPEADYPSVRDAVEIKVRKIRKLYEDYGAGPAERLSGVDLLKRWGVAPYGKHFPSTSHMAALPFLKRLRFLTGSCLAAAQEAWTEYLGELQKWGFSPHLEHTPTEHPVLGYSDGSLLLESRLVGALYAPGEDTSKSSRLQRAKQALQVFYQKLDDQCQAQRLGLARPDPYYAFLQADGDGMGEIIDAQAAQGPERHQALSRQLTSFASQAREIVRKHQGMLIYAGGDDVVAFLPLDTMLECASDLARTFRTVMQGFQDQRGRKPSLSAGIAIAHHLDSLHRVRQLAHRAEQRAKRGAKNAQCITLSKRGGEDYHIVGQWDDLDESMRRLIMFCRNGAIPTGTAYELRELALRLGVSLDVESVATQKQAGPYAEVIMWDARRILKRKLYVPRPQPQAEEIARVFKARLGIKQECLSDEAQSDVAQIRSVPLGEFVHELIIAQVLADAQKKAEPEPKKEKSCV